MSDEPPHLRIVSSNDNPEYDMPSLRMWAVETAAMIVAPGPRAWERVKAMSEKLVGYVLYGERNEP